MICHLGPSVWLAWLAPAASGCTVSLLEPLLAAFVAVRPGFVGKIWLQHTHKQGLSLLRLPRKLDCSLRLPSGEPGAPVPHHSKLVIINNWLGF
jgi:hypothetical protein